MIEQGPSPVSDPTDVDPCPSCGGSSGVRVCSEASPGVRAWSCAACRTHWAITVATPRPLVNHLTATVELTAARSVLREVIALADQAPGRTDEQLRLRLRALAECTLPRSNAARRSPADRWLSEAPTSLLAVSRSQMPLVTASRKA
jgi:hypothetical protein